MVNNLIQLKQELSEENIFILQAAIRDLSADLQSGKKRVSGKIGLAKAIATCIRAQSSILTELTDSIEAKIYLKILTMGKVKQQALLESSGDFNDIWDAIDSLKSQGLIQSTEGGVQERELSPVVTPDTK